MSCKDFITSILNIDSYTLLEHNSSYISSVNNQFLLNIKLSSVIL